MINHHPCLAHRLLDQPYNPCSVVFRGVFWEETFSRRGNICVAEVCEDFRGFGERQMLDDADAKFIGAALESEGYHPVSKTAKCSRGVCDAEGALIRQEFGLSIRHGTTPGAA